MRQRVSTVGKVVIWSVSIAGAAALGCSIYQISVEPVRMDWLAVLALAVMLAWRAEISIPGIPSKITLTDAFIYLGALLLSPWAAAVLASADGLVRSTRGAKSNLVATAAVNTSAMSLSALTASLFATSLFGPLDSLVYASSRLDRFALALSLMAIVNWLVNTIISAASIAMWQGRPVLKTWRESYLWTSPAFFVGALIAGLIAKVITVFGFYSFALSLPMLFLTYIAYKIYLGKVEASHRHIEKLTRLHLATIESLTMAIDAKDPLTRGHIQRVRVLAEGFARAAGYPEDQMEGLKAAALLHDIGKLAVPEYILSKPGKLSAAEYSKVMVHPVVGADILSNVDFPYEVVPIVRHHHERYDGTGYPDRLKGKEIPLGARVLAIVDCYDALTTSRPYRKPHTQEQALELMQNERGRMFDPALLDTFLAVIGSLEDRLPALDSQPVTLMGVETVANEFPADDSFGPLSRTRAEKALRDIAEAQREVLSLYEIAQTLGSTLKLSEVLPIVATKLENIADFTTLIIYLAEGNRLRASYVIGRNSELLKGMEMAIGEGGTGWVGEHRQMLIGGSPLADLERPLGQLAAAYRSTAIFPLLHDDGLVGAIALYSEEDRGYSADEVRLLEAISRQAAMAIHNALAFQMTEESALTDNLTGLPNSRYMYTFFDQERSRAERHGYPLVLMMMDLDGFKRVNDTYGHHVGDDILRRVAQIARAQLRTGDILIRYAGDEFVAVLHRATPETVADLKDRLQQAIDHYEHEVRAGRIARIGISIGHATYGEDGAAIDELMEVADARMYEDKLARKRSATMARVATFPARAV